MREFTIDEFKKIQDEQNYIYLGLFDQQGETVIPMNSNKTTAAQRLKQIETRLKSAGLKDGYYIIKGKNSVVKSAKPDDYLILKGDKETALKSPKGKEITLSESPVVASIPIHITPELLTYESALALNVRVKSLELENEQLKKDNLLLQAVIRDLEAELEDEASDGMSGLAENAKTFLSDAMGFIAPLLDKHYDLKEKALGLRAIEIQHRMGNQNKPVKPPKPVEFQNHTNLIEDFVLSYAEDTDIYEQLAEIFNAAKGPEHFCECVKDLDQEIYNLLMQKLQ